MGPKGDNLVWPVYSCNMMYVWVCSYLVVAGNCDFVAFIWLTFQMHADL